MILATNIIENAFSPLIKLFQEVLLIIHSVVGGSWGWSIIGLTLVIRLITLPLTIRQFKGMAKLQQHAPEMKRIKERYSDDRQRQSEEMMKFYKENGVNPLASCLPLVLQLPVFISLFYMLRTDLKSHICGAALRLHGYTTATQIGNHGCQAVKPGSGTFLFITDITTKATGVVLVVLIVLYIGSQLSTSLLSSVSVDRNQRLMMVGLPFVFTLFVINFPAGLLLYWITTNLTMVGQQYYLRRHRPPPPAAVATAGGGTVANGAKAPKAARAAVARASAPARTTPPPKSPRQRKKRSGRRR
jgi:YidC/Oxa1 family membrane protein insertase